MEPVTFAELAPQMDAALQELQAARADRDAAVKRIAAAEVTIQQIRDKMEAVASQIVKAAPSVLPKN